MKSKLKNKSRDFILLPSPFDETHHSMHRLDILMHAQLNFNNRPISHVVETRGSSKTLDRFCFRHLVLNGIHHAMRPL